MCSGGPMGVEGFLRESCYRDLFGTLCSETWDMQTLFCCSFTAELLGIPGEGDGGFLTIPEGFLGMSEGFLWDS